MKIVRLIALAILSCHCCHLLTAQTILESCDIPYIDPQDADGSGQSRDTLLYTTYFEEDNLLRNYYIDINAFGGQQVDRAFVFAIMPDDSLKPLGEIAFGNCIGCVDGFALVLDDSLMISGINNTDDIELWLDGFGQPPFSLQGSLQTLSGTGRISGNLPVCAVGLQVEYRIFNNPANTTTEFSTQIVCPEIVRACSIEAVGDIDCSNNQVQLTSNVPTDCFAPTAKVRWFNQSGWTSAERNPTRSLEGNLGWYYLEVQEACCTYLDSVELQLPPFLNPVVDQTVCEQEPITFSASGGRSHFWEAPDGTRIEGNIVTFPQASTANEGQYIVHAFNEAGCEATDTLFLTVNVPPNPIWETGNYCVGDTVALQLSNDTAFQAINWFDPLDMQLFVTQINGITENQFGTYRIEAVDWNDCPIQTAINLTAAVPAEILIQTTETCDSIAVELLPADNQYQWDIGIEGNRFGTRQEGVYQVKVIDEEGCQTRIEVPLFLTNPAAAEIVVTQPICPGDPTGSIEFFPFEEELPIIFSIDGGVTYSVQTTFDQLYAGTYNVVMEDGLGCIAARQVTINEVDTLAIQILDQKALKVRPNTPIQLETQGLGNIQTYQWLPKSIDTGTPQVAFIAEKDMDIRIIVEDDRGCLASDVLTLSTTLGDIYIPNAFSPNQNGFNERFTFYSDGLAEDELELLRIFDRWGNLIFEANDIPMDEPLFGWDGNYKGKASPVGVYAYMGIVRFQNGVRKRFEGEVMLMK